VRDKVARLAHRTGAAAGATARDVRNRALGTAAEVRGLFGREPGGDRVVTERVRAEVGRWVSHPRALDVSVVDGRVTLRGPILRPEVDALLRAVRGVPGVVAVDARLDPHETAGDIPALQGGVPREPRPEWMQSHWSPAARLAAAAAGGSLALFGAARRGGVSTVAGLAGLGLLVRGLTDLEWRRLLGVGAGRRAVDLVKTINVAAPVETVYAYWSDYTRFPEFMAHVRDVRGRGEGRTHWVVAGPAGVPIEWDAVETQRVPNEILAWTTEPGSAVEHAGTVRFQPNRAGGTRVAVRMSYNPPAGALGHGVAALFGADPRSQMDADLARMKTAIETGTPPRDAAQPARDISSR
jgi:uncharacterized membrane protein